MVYYIHMVNSFLHAGPAHVLLDTYVLFDSEEYWIRHLSQNHFQGKIQPENVVKKAQFTNFEILNA